MGSDKRQVLTTTISAVDLITKHSPTAIHNRARKKEASLFQTFERLKILPRSLLNTPLIFKKRIAPPNHILDYFSTQTSLFIELINASYRTHIN
jgi:hypothetical protein